MGKTTGRIPKLGEILKRWRGKSSAPSDVPPGHVAVVVGRERRRLVVQATQLNRPAIRNLLAEAEEEYGFGSADGPIEIPCDEAVFLEALRCGSAQLVGRLRKCDPADSRRPGEVGQPLLWGLSVS